MRHSKSVECKGRVPLAYVVRLIRPMCKQRMIGRKDVIFLVEGCSFCERGMCTNNICFCRAFHVAFHGSGTLNSLPFLLLILLLFYFEKGIGRSGQGSTVQLLRRTRGRRYVSLASDDYGSGRFSLLGRRFLFGHSLSR